MVFIKDIDHYDRILFYDVQSQIIKSYLYFEQYGITNEYRFFINIETTEWSIDLWLVS